MLTCACAAVGLYPCRGNASYDVQWDTGSNKQGGTRPILHSVSYAAASTRAVNIELNMEFTF